MANKATGPEGIAAQHLLTLPDAGGERFAAMARSFEQLQDAAVKHWKVVFIPKNTIAGPVSMDKIRPLRVGSIVYRIWARCRVKQYVHSIERHLAPLQATSKMDPEVLHLVLQGERPPAAFPYGMALDCRKHLTALIAPLAFIYWSG